MDRNVLYLGPPPNDPQLREVYHLLWNLFGSGQFSSLEAGAVLSETFGFGPSDVTEVLVALISAGAMRSHRRLFSGGSMKPVREPSYVVPNGHPKNIPGIADAGSADLLEMDPFEET